MENQNATRTSFTQPMPHHYPTIRQYTRIHIQPNPLPTIRFQLKIYPLQPYILSTDRPLNLTRCQITYPSHEFDKLPIEYLLPHNYPNLRLNFPYIPSSPIIISPTALYELNNMASFNATQTTPIPNNHAGFLQIHYPDTPPPNPLKPVSLTMDFTDQDPDNKIPPVQHMVSLRYPFALPG